MILVFSDVHLGYDLGETHRCNREDFLTFLESYQEKKIDDLVILGDFFDFWRSNNARIVEDNSDIITQLTNLKADRIHYVAGNHDYYILDLNEKYEINKKIAFSKYLRLEDNGESFFFIHGYELESILWEFPASLEMYETFSKEMCFNKDTSGQTLSKIWSWYENIKKYRKRRFKKEMKKNPKNRNINEVKELSLSNGKNFLLGMKPDETLVFGHTHEPFHEKDKKVANTGSWINDIDEEYQQNSYLEIINGEIKLQYF